MLYVLGAGVSACKQPTNTVVHRYHAPDALDLLASAERMVNSTKQQVARNDFFPGCAESIAPIIERLKSETDQELRTQMDAFSHYCTVEQPRDAIETMLARSKTQLAAGEVTNNECQRTEADKIAQAAQDPVVRSAYDRFNRWCHESFAPQMIERLSVRVKGLLAHSTKEAEAECVVASGEIASAVARFTSEPLLKKVDEARRLCDYDLRVAQAELALNDAEIHHRTDPSMGLSVMPECVAAQIQIEQLATHFASEARVKELRVKFGNVCHGTTNIVPLL